MDFQKSVFSLSYINLIQLKNSNRDKGLIFLRFGDNLKIKKKLIINFFSTVIKFLNRHN